MKKRRLAALGLAMVMFTTALSGCSGGGSGEAGMQTAASQAQTTEGAGQPADSTSAAPSSEAQAGSQSGQKIFYWSSTSAASNISPFEGNYEIVD